MKPIQLIKISGSHFEAGRQLGAATADTLRQPIAPPEGRTWGEMRHFAQLYMHATQTVIPWLHQEMEGFSAGSDMDLLDLYACATEEIWDVPAPGVAPKRGHERCSDFAAGPRRPPLMAVSGWLTTTIWGHRNRRK